MINVRGLIALAIIAFASIAACQSRADTTYSCADVRAAVKTIQSSGSVDRRKAIEILEGMAKGNGASKEQIEAARKCLQ